MAKMPSVAIPGQLLAPISSHTAGPGTHVRDSQIYASILGPVVVLPSGAKGKQPAVLIPRDSARPQDVKSNSKRNNTLPSVNSVVLARVTRVQQRQATCSILCVLDSSSTVLDTTEFLSGNSSDDLNFQALLRREDVRAVEKDRVVMNETLRVGDIIRGGIISLGDQNYYYLTIASNEFGVIIAKSEDGNPMIPVSWKEMRDEITGISEARKVAKPG